VKDGTVMREPGKVTEGNLKASPVFTQESNEANTAIVSVFSSGVAY
jgi:hypothetical protein